MEEKEKGERGRSPAPLGCPKTGGLVSHRLDGTPHDASAEHDSADGDTGGHTVTGIAGDAGDGRGDVRGRSHGGDDGSGEHSASEEQFLFHVVVCCWCSRIGRARLPATQTGDAGKFSVPQLATALTAAHTQATPRGRSQRRIRPQKAAWKIGQSMRGRSDPGPLALCLIANKGDSVA